MKNRREMAPSEREREQDERRERGERGEERRKGGGGGREEGDRSFASKATTGVPGKNLTPPERYTSMGSAKFCKSLTQTEKNSNVLGSEGAWPHQSLPWSPRWADRGTGPGRALPEPAQSSLPLLCSFARFLPLLSH